MFDETGIEKVSEGWKKRRIGLLIMSTAYKRFEMLALKVAEDSDRSKTQQK